MTESINYHLEPMGPRVSVAFKKSSTKDAGEGFDVDVREGATEDEATRVMAMALRLRETALAALRRPTLEQQLEDSVKAMERDREFLAEARHDLR